MGLSQALTLDLSEDAVNPSTFAKVDATYKYFRATSQWTVIWTWKNRL
jgi:hypothetical protein